MAFDIFRNSSFEEQLAELNLTIQGLLQNLTGIDNTIANLATDDGNYFMMATAFIIFFLHPGFAFLEAGSVRSKNATNIMFNNLADICFAGIAYWGFGYSFSFGRPSCPFIGYGWFFGANMPQGEFSAWFSHFCYAATAATIVAGAVAERCGFRAYVIYSCVITGLIYPIVCHWLWDPTGWISNLGGHNVGYLDTAGSGVVHLTGGVCSLVAAILLGPRIGRFDENGKPVDIQGHSVMFTSFGGFALMFGLFAFNANSVAGDNLPSDRVALAMYNTVVAGAGAGVVTLLIGKTMYKRWSLLMMINGVLAGMVAICAGCDAMMPWAGFVTGVLAGGAFVFWSWLTLKLKVDDPLDAWAVHGGSGGLVGLLTRPFFQWYSGPVVQPGIIYSWSRTSFDQLGYNLFGCIMIVIWCSVTSAIMFGTLRWLRMFRVKEEYEIKGLDVPKHGEPAYPVAAYWSGWEDSQEEGQVAMLANYAQRRRINLGRTARSNNYATLENAPDDSNSITTVDQQVTPAVIEPAPQAQKVSVTKTRSD